MMTSKTNKNILCCPSWLASSVAVTALVAEIVIVTYLIRRRSLNDTKTNSLPEELKNTEYTKELKLAISLALKAGKNMIPHVDSKGTESYSESLLDINTKSNRNDFATAIDRENEEFISRNILATFPEDCIIGEETTGTGSIPELSMKKTWILDPVDGTTNFANGLPLCCVSIGLCDQKKPVLGCIYVPMTQELYLAVKGHGAYRNGVRIHSTTPSSPKKMLRDAILVIELGHSEKEESGVDRVLSVFRKLLLEGIRASRQFGSGVLDLCYVASGRVDVVYAGIHGEGWKPWDYCAGVVVAQEAGAVVKSIFGPPGKEGSTTNEFDLITGAVVKDAPDFDIYSKSVICGTSAELVAECRNVILSALKK
jgi:fructose-1,6-bisphosphatase/inositol monophosphatase family enzyme